LGRGKPARIVKRQGLLGGAPKAFWRDFQAHGWLNGGINGRDKYAERGRAMQYFDK